MKRLEENSLNNKNFLTPVLLLLLLGVLHFLFPAPFKEAKREGNSKSLTASQIYYRKNQDFKKNNKGIDSSFKNLNNAASSFIRENLDIIKSKPEKKNEVLSFSSGDGSYFLSANHKPSVWEKKSNLEVPDISAESALVMGINDGYIFYQKNPSKILPIASLTKLMTALIAFTYLPADFYVKISKEAASLNNCSLIKLKEGEIYSRDDLIKLILLVSSNQAAYALGSTIGTFVDLMNNKAAELKMNNTYFDEPTGLSSKNRSSALDIFKLVKHIYLNIPEIFSQERVRKDTVCAIFKEKRNCHTLYNIDLFAGKDYFLGGKTGYTPEAGGCLVSVFKWKEPVVVVVLNSKDRFRDSEKLYFWLRKVFK